MIPYGYNTQVNPPAPFVLVTLRNPMTGEERTGVPAQFDTAADRSVLPAALVGALGLEPTGSGLFQGFDGPIARKPLYGVLLGVHTFPPRLVEVLAHPDERWILLGRDVLNEIRCLLDGPSRRLEIDDPSGP
jgi:hypothetical protein